ncbi:hypothetical protein BRADI_1g73380v3 [Brachypodium distachyon]|uniref:Uncharacterized protein n=1 Tax=Brachypodium distachyon TaxID=15368 RepID=A0A0Q3LJI8_BRADI|nr:hypothetical protein BRADI_1g73380v3 [Brachypodium distachyon]
MEALSNDPLPPPAAGEATSASPPHGRGRRPGLLRCRPRRPWAQPRLPGFPRFGIFLFWYLSRNRINVNGLS